MMNDVDPEKSVLTDEEVRSFSQAILTRHGIDFTCYEPKSLKRRVAHAMHVFKCTSIHELWIKMLREPNFTTAFMDTVSVGLTSMFRDPVLWMKLKQLLAGKFSGRNVDIWHAGCSTGEEIFSMSIVAKETGHDSIKAIASDISLQSLDTARNGIYNKMKLPEFEANYAAYNPQKNLSQYFCETGSDILMNKELINHVEFKYHNLITDPFPEKFDLIFCRNVMIYFDHRAKLMLFEKFHKALKPDGLFVIGFYDAVLPIMDHQLFAIEDMDAKIFKKI